jgi:glutathione-regulated potassium-efflux system protein KefB
VLALVEAGVDYHMRETYESAIAFGRTTMEALGVDPSEADEIVEDVRERDAQRVLAQVQGGIYAGMDLINTKRLVQPEPLERPERVGITLNQEAVRALEAAREEEETG